MVYNATQKIVVVEGNVGAGKSTFLRLLGKHLPVHLVYEPHEKWQNIGGENLLDYFYKDSSRWAYTFQSYAFITRVLALEQQIASIKHPIIILERSVYSDRYCFAKNCFELGLMTSLEWKVYQEWFEWLVEERGKKPDAFIYLQTDPEICYRRMLKRSRSEEAAVPLNYLQMLHDKHENWLLHKQEVTRSLVATPVLTLECNEDFEHNALQFKKHVDTIEAFLTDSCRIMPLKSLNHQPAL